MESYAYQLAAILAREINKNTRKHFGTLHADAIEEIENMNKPTSCVTSSMDIKDTPAARIQMGREIPNTLGDLAAASPARLPAVPSADSVNSGMSVASPIPAVTIKPVDRKTIQGSYPGDSRYPNTGAGITDQFHTCPGPRDAVRGQKNSKYSNENHPSFASSGNDSDSDAGN